MRAASALLVCLLLGGCQSTPAPKPRLTLLSDPPVLPLMEVAADELARANPNLEITLQGSGNRSSISAFCAGGADAVLALGRISAQDLDSCRLNRVEFESKTLALDTVALVVNRDNTWVDALTKEELKKLWTGKRQDSITWADLRKTWPPNAISTFLQSDNQASQARLAQALGLENLTIKSGPTDEIAQEPLQGLSAAKYGIGIFNESFVSLNSEKLKRVHLQGLENLDLPITLFYKSSLQQEIPTLANPNLLLNGAVSEFGLKEP